MIHFCEGHDNKNIHTTFRFLIIIAQCFGFFPVQGIFSNNIKSLKFSWWSVRVCLSAIIGCVACICALAHLRLLFIGAFTLSDFGGVIFNGCNGSHFFSFLYFAKKWPEFTEKFSILESRMAKYGYSKYLNLKFKIIALIFLSLEIGEHLHVQIKKVETTYLCTESLDEGLRFFLHKKTFPHVFQMFEYSHFKGVVLQIVNTCLACVWTYTDLFIILISYYIAEKFHYISKWLKHLKKNRIRSEEEWRCLRQNYNDLGALCKFVNEHLSTLIITAFFTNIYFIVIGLFYGLHSKHKSLVAFLKEMLSFSLLVMRSTCVCWFAGKVNEESEEPRQYIISIPSQIHNIEIERFVDELRYTCISITGKNFFKIKKILILKIVGAILTYELVLAQYMKMPEEQPAAVVHHNICQ